MVCFTFRMLLALLSTSGRVTKLTIKLSESEARIFGAETLIWGLRKFTKETGEPYILLINHSGERFILVFKSKLQELI